MPSAAIGSFLRPDRRIVVRPSTGWTDAAASAATEVARQRGATVIAFVGDDETADRSALARAGFSAARREAVVEISVDRALNALAAARMPAEIDVRSATEVDPDGLRLLDDELRNDVPGTSGWRNTEEQFRSDTFEDRAFDAETYLIAGDAASGDHVGLVRIWMNPGGPRIGLIGVRRPYRRRGIGSALLARALAVLPSRGMGTVTAEYDLANPGAAALFARLEARRIRAITEFCYTAPASARVG